MSHDVITLADFCKATSPDRVILYETETPKSLTDYIVATETDVKRFEQLVNAYLEAGYSLNGVLHVNQIDDVIIYQQGLIKI